MQLESIYIFNSSFLCVEGIHPQGKSALKDGFVSKCIYNKLTLFERDMFIIMIGNDGAYAVNS